MDEEFFIAQRIEIYLSEEVAGLQYLAQQVGIAKSTHIQNLTIGSQAHAFSCLLLLPDQEKNIAHT